MTAQTFADLGIDVPYGRSGEVDTLCPQCSHTRKKSRDKCLSVNTETGTYFCHHCQWNGGLTTSNTIGYGAPLTKREYAKPAPQSAPEGLPAKAQAFFAERGITPEVLERNKISFDGTALRFPYYRDGELINIKFRGPGKRFWMVKDAERILYGLDDCAGDELTVLIVEGEMDKLACEVAGYPMCLSVPDGAPPPDAKNYSGKFDFLASTDVFNRAKKVVIATDMDAPGQRLADELARRIGPHKCWRIHWPDGCKDANDTLITFGPEEIGWRVDEAQPWPIAGLVTIPELAPALDALYEAGLPGGLSTGWATVDACYTVRPGLFSVITGSPGAGKSRWLDALMVNMAIRHGWTFGVCSPENQPLARHAAGMIAVYRDQPFGEGPTPRMTHAEMHQGRDWLAGHVAFVLPEEPTLNAILERARVLVYRMGINGLVIDPWNELDHSRPVGMTETEYISQCLSQIRTFARNYDVHVWLVAHPTKLQKTSEGVYPVPTPYDISGSAHWFAKADHCLTIHRDKRNPLAPVQLHIQKVRFQETGQLGMVEMTFTPSTGKYREVRA